MKNKINIVLVALYRYGNIPVRIMQPLLEKIEGIRPYTIFFKNCIANVGKPPTKTEEKLFVKQIIDLDPKLVGISVLSPFVPIAAHLTKLIKDNSSALIIWGGIHPTISPETCINEVDMLCVGEGEDAIMELAEHLRDGKDYLRIKNLWINHDGYVIRNPMRPLKQDLDSLPNLSYSNDSFYFIDSNRVTKKDSLLLAKYLLVQASRGCPFACSYCVNSLLRPLYKGLGSYFRRRSVDSIIKEIKHNLALTKNVDSVYFIDEVFGSDETWLEDFESKYKKEV